MMRNDSGVESSADDVIYDNRALGLQVEDVV